MGVTSAGGYIEVEVSIFFYTILRGLDSLVHTCIVTGVFHESLKSYKKFVLMFSWN